MITELSPFKNIKHNSEKVSTLDHDFTPFNFSQSLNKYKRICREHITSSYVLHIHGSKNILVRCSKQGNNSGYQKQRKQWRGRHMIDDTSD